MKFALSGLGAALLLSACAAAPEAIPAADIGRGAYAQHSCAQLGSRYLELTQEIENLSARQRSARTGDTVGVVLLGLPLSSMSGNDNETSIAVARGHLQEVEREAQAKNCSLPRPATPATVDAPAAPS